MTSLYELQQQGQQGTGNPALDEAVRINQSAAQVYERIRSNADLSDAAKQKQLAAAYAETHRRLAAHKAATDQARADRVTTLTRSAFGAPTDPIAAMSYRQAQQIAENIDDPHTAQQKLAAAMTEGDSLLAQAIARHATARATSFVPGISDPQWGGVVDTYTAANPRVGDALKQLSDMQQGTGDQFRDALYFMSPKPSELSRLDDTQIEQLAAQPATGA